jgi:hypothetical protein
MNTILLQNQNQWFTKTLIENKIKTYIELLSAKGPKAGSYNPPGTGSPI